MTINGINTNTGMMIRTVCIVLRTFGCVVGVVVAPASDDDVVRLRSPAGRKRHICASRPCATTVYVGLGVALVDEILCVYVEDIEDVIG